MALRSRFDERPAPVVPDTSVVINLNATGCSEAIPYRCSSAPGPAALGLDGRSRRSNGADSYAGSDGDRVRCLIECGFPMDGRISRRQLLRRAGHRCTSWRPPIVREDAT